jgi:hypothetical protein
MLNTLDNSHNNNHGDNIPIRTTEPAKSNVKTNHTLVFTIWRTSRAACRNSLSLSQPIRRRHIIDHHSPQKFKLHFHRNEDD